MNPGGKKKSVPTNINPPFADIFKAGSGALPASLPEKNQSKSRSSIVLIPFLNSIAQSCELLLSSTLRKEVINGTEILTRL